MSGSGVPDDMAPAVPAVSRDESFQTHVVPQIDVLYRVAVSLTGHPADAEDLVQDTLLRAYRAVDRFDGRHPRAWLLTILRNTHINRARKRQPTLLADGESAARVLEESGPASPSSEELAMIGRFEPVVARALEALPADFFAVVDLVDLQGLSYAEAADRLGVPKGTVMSRLHRARQRIRSELDAAGLVPRVGRS